MKFSIVATTVLLAAAPAFAADPSTSTAPGQDAATLKAQHTKTLAACNSLTGKERESCIREEHSKYDKAMKTATGDRNAPAANPPSANEKAAAEATHVK